MFCPSSSQVIPDKSPENILKYSYGAWYATNGPANGKSGKFAHNLKYKHIPLRGAVISVLGDTALPETGIPSHIFFHNKNLFIEQKERGNLQRSFTVQ